jgi:hypothetical protein
VASEKQLKIHRSAASRPPFLPSPHAPVSLNFQLLTLGICFSNSQPLRLEPLATCRKQTTGTKSNSQLWPLSNYGFLRPWPSSQDRFSRPRRECQGSKEEAGKNSRAAFAKASAFAKAMAEMTGDS